MQSVWYRFLILCARLVVATRFANEMLGRTDHPVADDYRKQPSVSSTQ